MQRKEEEKKKKKDLVWVEQSLGRKGPGALPIVSRASVQKKKFRTPRLHSCTTLSFPNEHSTGIDNTKKNLSIQE